MEKRFWVGFEDNSKPPKKIYVGDIIQAYDLADGTMSTGYPYRIEIKFETPAVMLEKYIKRSKGKVIGNMKDNPELLTEETHYGSYKLQ